MLFWGTVFVHSAANESKALDGRSDQVMSEDLVSKIQTQNSRSLTDVVTFGPLGVLPEYRNRGIAAKLIQESIRLAKLQGFCAVIIQGDPRFYGRLGFRCHLGNLHEPPVNRATGPIVEQHKCGLVGETG